jgi:disulfide bond formation protein DsbB
MHKYYKIYFKFIGAAALFALLAAYFSEYVLKLLPCKLCYYQRYVYMVMLVLCIAGYFISKFQEWGVKIVLLCLLGGIGLAFTHVGVENEWFVLDLSCTGNMKGRASTIEEYKALIMEKDDVPCDVVREGNNFLGITMAGWNFIYSLLLFMISLALASVFMGKPKYEKK